MDADQERVAANWPNLFTAKVAKEKARLSIGGDKRDAS